MGMDVPRVWCIALLEYLEIGCTCLPVNDGEQHVATVNEANNTIKSEDLLSHSSKIHR